MKARKGPVIVCRCEDITQEDIVKAIQQGYTILEEIKRHLRCGMGACQGRTCMPLIARIVWKNAVTPAAPPVFPTVRPPLRPVTFAVLAKGRNKK